MSSFRLGFALRRLRAGMEAPLRRSGSFCERSLLYIFERIIAVVSDFDIGHINCWSFLREVIILNAKKICVLKFR